MKSSFQTKYLIPIACLVVGIFIAIFSYTQYELWTSLKGPMSGFLPFVTGVLMIITGLVSLNTVKADKEPIYQKNEGILILAMIAMMLGNYIIGFLPSLFLFVFLWLKVKEKCSWKTTILVIVILFVIIVGVFDFWLNIPFGYGLLFSGLMG